MVLVNLNGRNNRDVLLLTGTGPQKHLMGAEAVQGFCCSCLSHSSTLYIAENTASPSLKGKDTNAKSKRVPTLHY
ncbi:hypothetical protein L6164_026343 [Bauhinia variegata]|uniref:Uncharacterized protein n=1 Tax=Bauhinia variegata TaxID=167791 RepID=A0ACB9LQE7_BAUVA|nr:hypothetical protein L6164_026343 [Bauhinia variegata]